MNKLRILVADDHSLVRHGARALLDSQNGWKVVGEAANGREAVEKAIELKPDIAVVDIGMPELDGVDVSTRTLVSGTVLCISRVRGYLLKSDLTDCLMKAVAAVAAGKLFLTPKVSEIVLEGFLKATSNHQQKNRSVSRTTPREVEIIRSLGEGKTNKEIAVLLGITSSTVETHRANIMIKLGVHSLAELIHYSIKHGMVQAQGN